MTDARYDVQPAQHRVRVTLDMVLTNHLHDTSSKRFYFDRAFLSVLPGTSGFKLSWSGAGSPKATVSKKTATYTVVQLDLAKRIYSGKSAHVPARLRPGRHGRRGVARHPDRRLARVVPGLGLRDRLDAGQHGQGRLPVPATRSRSSRATSRRRSTGTDGAVTFQTGKLATPLAFFAYLVGDRPGSYVDRSVSASIGSHPVGLTIRSWADDPGWSKRVGDLMVRGLPAIAKRRSGWPGRATGASPSGSRSAARPAATPGCSIRPRAPSRSPTTPTISSSSTRSAHAWFNGSLLTDRWADEGFASYYGLEAAKALGIKTTADPLTDTLKAARIPLNAWGAIGREDSKTEDYAYAATVVLARAIAERAGPAGAPGGLGRCCRQDRRLPAAGGSAMPRPARSVARQRDPEMVDGPPDWRGLLDLLEAHSASSFEDLWRTWVARDTDLPLLDDRAAARADYDAVVTAAGRMAAPAFGPRCDACLAVRPGHRSARQGAVPSWTSGRSSRTRRPRPG